MDERATITVYEGTPSDVDISLRALFDSEYANAFGVWDPGSPYGYAPIDVHIVASAEGSAVGHVGFQRRTVTVGGGQLVVGGTGGVLVAPKYRGLGLGRRLMTRVQETMRSTVDFGYLGCREEVVDFYAACGWARIRVEELSVPRSRDAPHLHPAGAPIMICSARSETNEWPSGTVDLRGRAW